nr:DUF2007 domain-containing protein [Erwinia sp. S38]
MTRCSYVLLAQYLSPVEAHIEAGLLKSEGIYTLLLDENMVWNNQMYSLAVGGVKLLVKQADAEISAQILATFHNNDYRINDDKQLAHPSLVQTEKPAWRDNFNTALVLLLFIITGIALPLHHTSTQFVSPSPGDAESG